MIKSKSPKLKNTEQLISTVLQKDNKNHLNVNVIDLFFLQGSYDWLIKISASDIQNANKFAGYIETSFGEIIQELELIENIFSLVKKGKINPNLEKINQFKIDMKDKKNLI
ncbi:MAG: hypothetical protein V5A68_06415 [Candidatus Thermoplasmatota archaeon]